MSATHSRTQAKRNTLLAQGAALLLAAVAVGAILVGVPGVRAPEAEVQEVSEVLAQRQAERQLAASAKVVDEGAVAREIDLHAVAERLELIHKGEIEVAAVEPTGGEGGEPVDEQKLEIKYLGHITEPNRQLALLSVNGQQRIVPVGSSARFSPEGIDPVSIRIVGVSSDAVTYERDGVQSKAEKGPRMAGAVTQVQVEAPAAARGGLQPGQPGQPGQAEESELDRRRREAMERRQRIIDRQEEQGDSPQRRGRPDGEN